MKRTKILIVDDVDINREILIDILSSEYELLQGENGLDAVEMAMAHSNEIAIILLDVMMPEMNGFEALEILKGNAITKDIAVIMITAANSTQNEMAGLRLGACDFISKPFNRDVVKMRISSQMKICNFTYNMNQLVSNKVAQIEHVQEVVIDLLANLVECRDLESGWHIQRTRYLVKLLIEKLIQTGKLDPSLHFSDVNFIVNAVVLHDVGKIGIPDNILQKPDKLTPEEFETMKSHTIIGSEIANKLLDVQSPVYVRHIQDICLYHHEKWDGTGYPHGLSGEEIPYSARLMAIVDVYDAMTSKRVYKPALPHETTMEIIRESAGKHFDPVLAEVFYEFRDEFRELAEKYKD